MDPLEFLRRHPPFSAISEAALARVARELEIVYAERGRRLLEIGGEPSSWLYVLRKGSVKLELDGRILDELGPGEPFGYPSLISGGPPRFDVWTQQDCLLYRLSAASFRSLLESEPAFGEFFLSSLAERLRLATSREAMPLAGDLATPAARLSAGPPLVLPATASVGEAARAMRDRRVSSVLLAAAEGALPTAILTDRDLRSRVLAQGRGPETPALAAASSPLLTLPAATSLFEALVFSMHHRIHHLPLTEDGAVTGVITHSDLVRHQLKSPGHLLRRIARVEGPEQLGSYAAEMTGMAETLFWGGLEPAEIGRVVSALNDALVERLLALAEERLGPPPCPYRWLVFGSEGRHEQALLTDQDNALVYDEDTPRAGEYFRCLAGEVVGALLAASIPECAGGFMATRWCLLVHRLEAAFRQWGSSPEPQAVMNAANFFDFRPLSRSPDRDSDVERLEEAVRAAAASRIFLARLAKTSLEMRPPLGLLGSLRAESGRVDLKAGGLIPIVGLARTYALEAGRRQGSTLERLEAARRAGIVSEEGHDTLAEAFRFLFRMRLRRQLEARRLGEGEGNRVRLADLAALERRHLKDAFQAIREMQAAAAQRYGLDLLG